MVDVKQWHKKELQRALCY